MTLKPTDRLREERLRCVRCGTCLSVCPVYGQLRREWAVARGRVALLQAEEKRQIALDRRLRTVMTSCLLCGRCRENCPNQVDTPALVKAARSRLVDTGEAGGGTIRSLLRTFLPRRHFATWVRLARALRPLWATAIPEDSGLYLRLVRAGGEKIRVPCLAPRFLDTRALPSRPAAEAAAEKRLIVFPGCIERYVRPEMTLAEAEWLRRAGFAARVPEGLGCCGLAAWSAGEEKLARRLIRHNLELLLPAGEPPPAFIVSSCASCSYLLRHAGELFPEASGDLAARLRILSERSLSFSQLHGQGSGEPAVAAAVDRPRIGWHQPCHLEGDPQVAPARLKALPGAVFVELESSRDCCGGGGIFSFLYPGLSERIGRHKRQEVIEKRIGAVVTECSGCLLQLERLLAGTGVEVLTLAQALTRFGGAGG